ncbi:MAG TPA: hypothetical protein VGX37_12610 [Allosphingosinicella sp.]|jgi:hypothetical protein|nr:hypothetical protein [Allosphingosinicella sp.]
MIDQGPAPSEALQEMRDLLHRAAAEGDSQRHFWVRYTICREALLASDLKPSLPGFLLQCVTFSRFQEFIRLYHPQSQKRAAFIEQELQAFTGRVRARPTFDVFEGGETPRRASA